MSGSAEKPYVLDDSDNDEAPRHTNGRRTYIEISSPSDLSSHSPPPPSKTLPLRDNPQSRSSSLRPPILEQLPKRTSLRSSSSSSWTPQDQSPTKSLAASIKVSPRASKKPFNDTSTTSNEAPTVGEGKVLQTDSNVDEMEGIEKLLAGPKTRSRQDSPDGAESQESFDRSIGSASPLLIRLKEQRSRTRKSTSNHQGQPTSQPGDVAPQDIPDEGELEDPAAIAKIEHFLSDLVQKFHDDHATAVQWILYNAKRGVESRKSICVEEESPFSSLNSVHISPGTLLPDGVPVVHSESTITRKNRLGRSKSLHSSKTIKSETPRVPKYSHNTTVRRNILTMDDEKLRYIPYMAEAESSKKKTARLLDELQAAYNPKATSSGRETEWSYQNRAYLTEYLPELELPLTLDILVQYVLGQFDPSSRRNTKDIQAIVEQYEEPLEPSERQLAKAFSEAYLRIHKISLRDTLLPDDRLKEMAQQLKKPIDDRLTKTPPKGQTGLGNVDRDDSAAELNFDRLGTYTTLTCLICGAMSCQTHGDSVRDESAPGYHQYIHQPLVTTYQDILRKQDASVAGKTTPLDFGVENEIPCGPECHLVVGTRDSYEYDIPPDILAKVESMVISLRDKARRSCTIAFFVDRPCWQVHLEIQHMEPRTVELPPPCRTKQPDWYNNQKKTLKWDWQDLTTAHLHQERCQANPCAHDGPCLKGCPCYDSVLLCESICGCTDDCPRKFTGCACHSAGHACVSDSCACVQMNRECGPQCSSCGAIPRLDPDSRYQDELFATGCQNIHLQRGVTRKLILGESQLEGVGFGLYLGEPVRKGEFLSEYTGEVISFLEADRRGIIYDRKFLSFLFDLNSEWAIDAARLGNKSRFINHSDNDKDGLNCEAKIVLVNGEHRIKFMALRDIKVGEELLFNYGKKFADKHGLNKKLPKAKDGAKRGVVVGEEALEALDGLNPASRETRGKMTAIRGGHGGGRNRKARKAAPAKEPQTVVDETSQHSDVLVAPQDDGEEDEEDHDGRKKKRKIVRPSRYTR